jgi:nucleoid-associated protein YgaU
VTVSTRYFIAWCIALFALTMLFAVRGRARLVNVFDSRVEVSAAQPIERIRGGMAGPAVTVAAEPEDSSYLVQPGDSWSRIAKKKGINDYNALAEHNDYRKLEPGITIQIPAELMERP